MPANQNQDDHSIDAHKTKRIISPELEKILGDPIKVLDHGFIRVVDYMGTDSSIVQAARVSYGKGTKLVNQDKGLINYLMRHKHTTPFEMCDIKFHIKLPMFIARQWIRHRTASVNEYSARYSILANEFYIPENQHICSQSQTNKQGRQTPLSHEESEKIRDLLKNDASRCYKHYERMLNEDIDGNIIDENSTGIARELARMNLTMNYYTEWYWKINLHNLLHFVHLRADEHAQYEIRVYAEVMLNIIKSWVPITYEAFIEYNMKGAHLSKKGIDVIKRRIRGEKVSQENSKMSKREFDELEKIFQ